eukprot:TRINITY_DN9503_c0_g1_i1.p1 TRINITY_DN9503_c0_g1~~TRINITY_DN9503_c0_g1_i1.p1  ORF type:complete len:485 (+),score=171.78 TRINITY_DN9503_c0_g1_i1:100-1554(+)
MRRFAVLLLVAALVGPVFGHRYAHYGLQRCSACKCVSKELSDRRADAVSKERAPMQVSHRLGKGKWDHHGSGGVKKVSFEGSELMAIEVVDGVCGRLSKYVLREEDGGSRVFSDNSSQPEASYYSKHEKELIGDSRKFLKELCEDLLDEHDELIHDLVRKHSGSDALVQQLCVQDTSICAEKTLAKFRGKEKSARGGWLKKERKKLKRMREAELTESVQMAEFRIRKGDDLIDLSAAGAASATGNSPAREGPMNLVDGNSSTKWLDWRKAPFEVTLPVPTQITDFTYVTADDHPERDPVWWTVYGKFEEPKPEPAQTDEATPEVPDSAADADQEGRRRKAAAAARHVRGKLDAAEGERKWQTLHSQQTAAHTASWERKTEQPWFPLDGAGKLWTHLRFTPGKMKKAEQKEKPTPPNLLLGQRVKAAGKEGVLKELVTADTQYWGAHELLHGGWVVGLDGGEEEFAVAEDITVVDAQTGSKADEL